MPDSARAQVGSGEIMFQEPVPSEAEEGESEEELDEIETDRDSFTPATTTAGYRRVIVESAYSFIDNRNVPETHSFPEMLLRYGANDWLELRLGWNYEIGGAGSPISGNVPGDFADEAEIEEESRLIYGFKSALTEQDCWLPSSALIVQGYTPTSGEATDSEVSTTYVLGWELENRWIWDSAIRYSTAGEGEDDFNVWAPSSVLKVPLGEHWKVHAEYFGIFSSGCEEETQQHYFSPGAHYLITPDLEVGVRVGWGLNDQAANFFTNAGFGWRY
jgi:hypothetical protein